jgi:hypothetical protein
VDRGDASACWRQPKNDEEACCPVARPRLLIGRNGDEPWRVALILGYQEILMNQEILMKMNESPTERIVRASAGAVLLIMASFLQGPYDIFQSIFGMSLLVFGGMSLVTGLVGYCPIKALMGVSPHSPKE